MGFNLDFRRFLESFDLLKGISVAGSFPEQRLVIELRKVYQLYFNGVLDLVFPALLQKSRTQGAGNECDPSTNLKMTNFRRFGAWLVLKFQTCDCEIEGSPTEGVHCGVSVGFPILALLSAAACLRDRRIPAALNQASAGSSDDPCCSCAERGLMKIIEENC